MSKLADIDSRQFRIRIFQPVILEYRKGLYSGLGKRYGDRIEVWASDCLGADKSIPLDDIRTDYGHPFIKIGPFLWQRRLSLRGMKKGDVLVVCGEPRQLSSLYFALAAKMRGIRVIWWGHHASANSKPARVYVRLQIAKKLSDIFLTYTDVGVNYLVQRGLSPQRVFATGNTIDTGNVLKAIARYSANGDDGKSLIDAFRRKNGLSDKKVLLFCGMMREKVCLDVLLRALAMLLSHSDNWHCVMIGDGERLSIWKSLCHELNLDEHITWTGAILGQEKLAPWFMSADLFVYPGRIGLSLIHAFSYGVPVLLNDNPHDHGPEYVVFKPGENGLAFKYGDSNDMCLKIIQALENPELHKLGVAGRDFIYTNYSMDKMVERYSAAIEAAAMTKRTNND